MIRGEYKGLKSKFKISNSLTTPKGPNSIKAVNGGFLARRGKEPDLRYYQRGTHRPPLDEKERGTNETSKGDKLNLKGGQARTHYKIDKKIDKEKYEDTSSNSSLNHKKKETTWEEGRVRARDIKKMLRKPRAKNKKEKS